jgi:hypothetical protein
MFQFALHEANGRFYTFTQDNHSNCWQYYETFKNHVKLIKYCGGTIGDDPGLIDAELALTNHTQANVMNL